MYSILHVATNVIKKSVVLLFLGLCNLIAYYVHVCIYKRQPPTGKNQTFILDLFENNEIIAKTAERNSSYIYTYIEKTRFSSPQEWMSEWVSEVARLFRYFHYFFYIKVHIKYSMICLYIIVYIHTHIQALYTTTENQQRTRHTAVIYINTYQLWI